MKYVFLAYNDEAQLGSLPRSELDALVDACRANDEALQASGYLLKTEWLHESRSATTVRIQNGRPVVADGPYAEISEQLVGLFVIDARDLNEAIQIAAQMPQARGGPIEVRPLAE